MSRRIATLNSSDRKERSRSSSRSSDDEKRQQGFFVGGSEHSGQQVLGPESSRNNDDVVSQFFQLARANGAEAVPPDESSRTRDAVKFPAGTRGYRLGDAVQPSEAVELEPASDELELPLIMWQNGFTLGDEDRLRRYADPPNNAFLQAVVKGRIPLEITRRYPGKMVNIRMERRHEPYVVKQKAFTGRGQRLGAIVPEIIGAGTLSGCEVASASKETEAVDYVKKAQEAVKLVDEEPMTQVQLRLPSGKRIVGRFNHTHTVQDVRTFVVNAVPDYAFQPFNLMTTFPNKLIEPESMSLKEAGLLNAVVVIKLV